MLAKAAPAASSASNLDCVDRQAVARQGRQAGRPDGVFPDDDERLRPIDFAPDGRTLASGQDSAILIWDLTGRAGKVKSEVALKAAELVALWPDLAADAAKAERALWTLAASPQQSLPLLQARLRPAAPPAPERVAKLIAALASQERTARQKAALALEE